MKKRNTEPLVLDATRPRNPLVVPALLRRAGEHRESARSERQRGRGEVRHELGAVLASRPAEG